MAVDEALAVRSGPPPGRAERGPARAEHASPQAGAGPRRARPRRSPSGLPASRSSFLGRDRELTELAQLLEDSRLVTLTGAPGVGKSRLGLELARELAGEHPDGVWLVELASLADGALVAGAVAGALCAPEVAGQSFAETIATRVGERRVLVVLDNCEHVIGACAQLVDMLLGACPALRVLATSREPLQIAGETVWQVPTLSTPGAEERSGPQVLLGYASVRLFVERARAVQPAFRLSSYLVSAVAEICRRLDGIPLALELAAARVEVLTPAEIARRLDDRFSLLRSPSRSELPRHQTLEAALDWSHDLLSPAERALLRRLSVFTGGFCLEAAEGACARDDENGELFDLLAVLVSRSLVVAETSNGSPRARYRLLETIRAYAAERLERAGETAATREAHAGFYLALAERAEPALTGPDQDRWMERLETDRANLRAAIEWSLSHGPRGWALRLSAALVLFWRVRCHFSEGRDLLAAAISANGENGEGGESGAGGENVAGGENGAAGPLRVRALWGAGFLTFMAGDLDGAVPLLEDSLARARGLGDTSGEARALLILGNAAQCRDGDGALPLLEQSAARAREAGDSWCLAHALGVAGFELSRHDELPVARMRLEECLAIARAEQDAQSLRMGLLGLGMVSAAQGDYRAAEPLLEEALTVTEELGEDYGRATALEYLGIVAVGRGQYARAAERLDAALAVLRVTGTPSQLVRALVAGARVARVDGERRRAHDLLHEALGRAGAGDPDRVRALQEMGELAGDEGELVAARRLYEESLDLARASRDTIGTAGALLDLGGLAMRTGDLRRATALHDEALELHRQIGNAHAIAGSLDAVAALAVTAGRGRHAARILGAAQAIREANGCSRLPWERSRYEADLAAARASLSPEEFERAFTQGAGWSIEEAVARASKRPGSRRRPGSGWSSLTDAERRVAALAAEGLTNPEIAERLYLSLGTVKTHLSHIFEKLGVARRMDLAQEVRRGDAGTQRDKESRSGAAQGPFEG